MILANHGIISSSGGLPPSTLLTNLYAVYNAESNANDSFGTLNGTANGGLTYTTGKIGNAFTLNGTNAYVSLPRTTNEFDFTGDFSISVWIKPTTQGTTNTFFQNFYSASASNRYGFHLYLQSARVRFGTYNITTNLANGNSVISNNTWYHVVITKTSGNAYKMYVNNTLQTLAIVAGDISNNPSYNTLNQVNIGSNFDVGARTAYFNGQIDELNTWTKELSASEITELYNSGNGKQYPY